MLQPFETMSQQCYKLPRTIGRCIRSSVNIYFQRNICKRQNTMISLLDCQIFNIFLCSFQGIKNDKRIRRALKMIFTKKKLVNPRNITKKDKNEINFKIFSFRLLSTENWRWFLFSPFPLPPVRFLLSPLPSKPRSQKDTLQTRLLPSILKAKAAMRLMGREELWSGHIYSSLYVQPQPSPKEGKISGRRGQGAATCRLYLHTHTTRVGAFILVFNSPQGASGNTAFL